VIHYPTLFSLTRGGEEEVSFQDIQGPAAANKTGYEKIKYCCEQAIKDKLDFVWVDTCCIDKSSSAELTEAINSMFCWYIQSAVCDAYLVDVPANTDPLAKSSSFILSRWFTRGWTLQELIAPNVVVFTRQTGPKSKLERKCPPLHSG
jgi:hypothetical protein